MNNQPTSRPTDRPASHPPLTTPSPKTAGLKLECSLGVEALADPECAEAVDPSGYIREAGFDYLTIGECVGCLFAYAAVCHTIGYIGKLAASLVGQSKEKTS